MSSQINEALARGGVGILATDTLYGVVGQALNEPTVQRIYRIKDRLPTSPFIILISGYDDLKLFGVELSASVLVQLEHYWPGPVSVILPCSDARFEYLLRGQSSLAFRMPAKPSLRRLVRQTGPLVAPSANPQGLEPAQTVTQARAYFGDTVDFYRHGRTTSQPSKLIRINGETIEVLRG